MELTMAKIHSLERVLVAASLVVLTLLAWAYLATGDSSGGMAMPMSGAEANGWNLHLLNLSVIMWAVMMVAMMLPGAAPMIMTYIRVYQRRIASQRAMAPTWVFIAGYLVVWTSFGITAAVTQWALHQTTLLSSAMGHVGPLSGAALLIVAGAFQFSHLKQACLGKCQSPLGFLMTEWREGLAGAFIMGARHGVFCAGCCWALMLLMFVGGVMSLAWMIGLALYFLAEKLVPWPRLFSHATGVILMVSGVLVATAH
ncbi:DUF2182 domain-containing protein [Marinobacter sp. 71-i]|uniref:DUF2182 domain-containing protein n=1 Tax=Marinobacter iranensis TaxID=2962607 RepID=A0ABT5Y667_9GAMM|nr:DUF2182 domain-containing protein [Marinobacter iranensis]MDF0749161.1 DUF2182 domain-containing protein [Marinobacter iranensis]